MAWKEGLTVGELIQILEQYDPELWVYMALEDAPYSVRCTDVNDWDIDIDGCITLESADVSYKED